MIIDRHATVQQRSALCYRSHCETRNVLRYSLIKWYGEIKVKETWEWINQGKKCKHCGRWV